MLRECASALSYSDATQAWHALIRGRNCQPLVDAMRQSLRASGEVATLAPAYRRHREELDQMDQSLDYIDLALRNSRVFARRLTSAINHAALSDEATQNIAEVLQDTGRRRRRALAWAWRKCTTAPAAPHLRTARSELRRSPSACIRGCWTSQLLEGETVVMLFRPLMVDLLEAAGVDSKEARDILPPL